MATATLTTDDVARLDEYVTRRSAESLADYLSCVQIDAQPEPMRWDQCIEDWQVELVAPIIPAAESVAGICGDYAGPMSFMYVLPKGHDKTALIARICNWFVGFSRKPLEGYAAASVKDQARLILKHMQTEQRLNPWLQRRIEHYNYNVKGPGGELTVLAADASNISGISPSFIICDELTFWDGYDLFDMLYGSRGKRDQCLFIIIMNAGLKDTWQHRLFKDVQSDPDWIVYQAPERTQLASWMRPEVVADIRRRISRGFARRVIDNEWIDATENPLLTSDLIQSCTERTLWDKRTWRDTSYRPELYIGVDFGRTKNRTVIWTNELLGDVAYCREVTVLHDVPFAEQEEIVARKLKPPAGRVIKCKLDKGAQGWTTVENLERRFPNVCQGEHLSGGYRGLIAANLKTAFERHRQRVPDDAEMRADLARVSEVDTVNGKPVLRVDEGADGFHADYFWAAALAYNGIPLRKPAKVSKPVARRSAFA